jgi:transcriptional regulator with XRE-family HTH domain
VASPDPLVLALARIRVELGVSQTQMAAELCVHRRTLNRYESGKTVMPLAMVRRYAERVGGRLAIVDMGED